MTILHVKNISKQTHLGTEIILADCFWLRLKGLLGTRELKQGQGLLLTPCKIVHGFGMRFPVEAVYLNRQQQVINIIELAPGRCGPFMTSAWGVLELPLGTVSHSCTEIGDFLQSTRT
ncbi:MAG: DUF192 domain-containing protein [Firmicutes bacterium]|jgi:uncharacterized membrane protein (UPF0127 family)|nr:DUF192 domain-containing protein [Bacillota bacterium]